MPGFFFILIKNDIIAVMYTSDTFIECHVKRDNGKNGIAYKMLLIIMAAIILATLYGVPLVLGFYELLYASGISILNMRSR